MAIDAHENLASGSPACPVRHIALPFPVLASTAACSFPSPAEDFFREEDRLDLNAKLAFHQDAYKHDITAPATHYSPSTH